MKDNAKQPKKKTLDTLKGQKVKGENLKGGIGVKFGECYTGGCGDANSTPGGTST